MLSRFRIDVVLVLGVVVVVGLYQDSLSHLDNILSSVNMIAVITIIETLLAFKFVETKHPSLIKGRK